MHSSDIIIISQRFRLKSNNKSIKIFGLAPEMALLESLKSGAWNGAANGASNGPWRRKRHLQPAPLMVPEKRRLQPAPLMAPKKRRLMPGDGAWKRRLHCRRKAGETTPSMAPAMASRLARENVEMAPSMAPGLAPENSEMAPSMAQAMAPWLAPETGHRTNAKPVGQTSAPHRHCSNRRCKEK